MTNSLSGREWKCFSTSKGSRYIPVEFVDHPHSTIDHIHLDIQWYVDTKSAIHWYLILWIKETDKHEVECRKTCLGGSLIGALQEADIYLRSNEYCSATMLTDQTYYNSKILPYICSEKHYPTMMDNTSDYEILKWQIRYPKINPRMRK